MSSSVCVVIFSAAYLASIATAPAIYLRNKAIEMLGAGITSIFFFAQPVAGALLGWLLLHEQLGVNFFVGGALILVAVVRQHDSRFEVALAIHAR